MRRTIAAWQYDNEFHASARFANRADAEEVADALFDIVGRGVRVRAIRDDCGGGFCVTVPRCSCVTVPIGYVTRVVWYEPFDWGDLSTWGGPSDLR